MHTSLKRAMLTGATCAFIAMSGATLTSSPTQAGPLSVTSRQDVAPAALTEAVQYRRRGGVGVRYGGARHIGVRHGGYRYGGVGYRRGYWGGRGYYNHGFFPAAALGLFAGALGAVAIGASSQYCDPYYYTWNYCGGYSGYGGGYYPAYYGGGYYPAYWGGGYPVYRTRVVRYRTVHRPRVVRYRAVGPRRHFVGSRTYVRSGYAVRRGRR